MVVNVAAAKQRNKTSPQVQIAETWGKESEKEDSPILALHF